MRHRFVFTHTFKHIIVSIVILEAFIVFLAIYQYGLAVEGMQGVARYSGRFSLFLFSLIFLAGFDKSNVVIRYLIKPYHAFALAHGIHLVELLTYVVKAEIHLNPIRVAGGFLAYVLIFVMPILVDLYHKEKVSKKVFVVSEIIYHYYVWLIFFMTYLPRVRGLVPNAGGNYWEHVALLGWVSLMLGMRLPMALRRRRRHES